MIPITDHVEQGLAKLTDRWSPWPLFRAWCASHLRPAQTFEDFAQEFLVAFDVDTCDLPRLLILAKLVGQGPLEDIDELRAATRVRILVNKSNGTLPELYDIAKLLFAGPPKLSERPPAYVRVDVPGNVPSPRLPASLMREAKMGGVGMAIVYPPGGVSSALEWGLDPPRIATTQTDPVDFVSPTLDDWVTAIVAVEVTHEDARWSADLPTGDLTALSTLPPGTYVVAFSAMLAKDSGTGNVMATAYHNGPATPTSPVAVSTTPTAITYSETLTIAVGEEIIPLLQFDTAGTYILTNLVVSITRTGSTLSGTEADHAMGTVGGVAAYGIASADTDATSLNVPYPANVTTDTDLYLEIMRDFSSGSVTTPSGWSLLVNHTTTGVYSHRIFKKDTVTGSETGDLTVAMTGTGDTIAAIHAIMGAGSDFYFGAVNSELVTVRENDGNNFLFGSDLRDSSQGTGLILVGYLADVAPVPLAGYDLIGTASLPAHDAALGLTIAMFAHSIVNAFPLDIATIPETNSSAVSLLTENTGAKWSNVV